MLKYFKSSFFVTITGLILAWFWGEHNPFETGIKALFIVAFLAILEITLSFDNAVINASKLEKMSEKWCKRFVTWGIWIAVFGMRLIFPIVIVSLFSGLSVIEVTDLVFNDTKTYEHYLHVTHNPLVTFGGTFLLMIFLSYFSDKQKEINWLPFIEKLMKKLNLIKYSEVIISLSAILILQYYTDPREKVSVITAGIFGIILFLIINGLSSFLESHAQNKSSVSGEVVKQGFIAFLYLELIDASFSLDGVLGAFAISKDIIIICIGLAVGAMFVRSLTVYMAENKILKTFCFLENGAHWAIGFLSVIMFLSTKTEISEIVTGGIGLIFVLSALIASIIYNKKNCKNEINE